MQKKSNRHTIFGNGIKTMGRKVFCTVVKLLDIEEFGKSHFNDDV
jgi:hypothetical protein